MQNKESELVSKSGLVTVADEKAVGKVPLHYCHGKWFGPNRDGGFCSYKDTQAGALLGQFGFNRSQKNEHGNTSAEVASLWLMQNRSVNYAGPLAGYPVGQHVSGQQRILVTEALKLVKPKAGKWPTIQALIQPLLEDEQHDQITMFYNVCSRRFTHLFDRLEKDGDMIFQHCPALGIFGARHSGKSALFDLVLTPLFGGRVAVPLAYLNALSNGQQPFNKDLIPAVLQILDDKSSAANLEQRRARGDAIKSMIWSPNQRLEGKNVDALMVSPFWWLIIAGNLEDESLNICPTLNESLEDKIILLKASKVEGLPQSDAEKNAWKRKLTDELPAFAHFLLHYSLPKSLRKPTHENCHCGKCVDGRTGVLRFWHPEIATALLEKQPECKAIEVIDLLNLAPWKGTATEFYSAAAELDKCGHYERLFSSIDKCGRMLTELSKTMPTRVEKNIRDGYSFYTVNRK